MRDSSDASLGRDEIGAATGRPLVETKGFTSSDLMSLQAAHQSGITGRGLGRGQFVTNEFSQYLTIWDHESVGREEPSLSIIRFGTTGTSSLLVTTILSPNGNTQHPS